MCEVWEHVEVWAFMGHVHVRYLREMRKEGLLIAVDILSLLKPTCVPF